MFTLKKMKATVIASQSYQGFNYQCQQFWINYICIYVSLSRSTYFRIFSCPISHATLWAWFKSYLITSHPVNQATLLIKPSFFYYSANNCILSSCFNKNYYYYYYYYYYYSLHQIVITNLAALLKFNLWGNLTFQNDEFKLYIVNLLIFVHLFAWSFEQAVHQCWRKFMPYQTASLWPQ